MFERPRSGERALLVRIGLGGPPGKDELSEFEALARSAGADVLRVVTGTRRAPDPRLYIGSGKAEEIRGLVAELGADLVVFDHALSPSQERNLEALLTCRVLDRTGLILDIFAQRARSFEGQLQVELAQLKHLATRLVRGWTHLERQKGGIGLRGPGETQLETDRRLLGGRIKTLNARLDKVVTQRETTRRERKRAEIPTVALVGYTNAGKTTLFNVLTRADAEASNALFVTLDPVAAAAGTAAPQTFAESRNRDAQPIKDLDFRRGPDAAGRVMVELPNNQVGVDIRQQGQTLVVEFLKSALPEGLRRRMDVTDFGTPIQTVTTFQAGDRVRVVIEPKGAWEHSAYQSDNQFVVEVRTIKVDPSKLTQGRGFEGEKLSLNFQNIEVR
ncbi:MAG TPA: GTPase HflX, partial [Casimicrobiaceae bacterium]|nr:GTPase HflX [Casimicrobiaceae bacterium]